MSTPDLAHTPAAPPPAGQTSNFVDPPSQQAAMIGVSATMTLLTLVFLSVRFYTSLRITRRPGIEDWLCLAAAVLVFGYTGVILDLSYVSRHMWDVPEIWFTENYWKIRFGGNTLQALAYFTSRMPILLLYIRLFGTTLRFRIACYIAIGFAVGTYITSIPLISYFCTPRTTGGDWNSLEVFAECKKLLDWAMVQGSCDIALNVYIFFLPIPTILGLHMDRKKRLGVLAIFMTGLVAILCSALGLYYRYKLSFTSDVNWNEGAFICMSVVEINIAIICSCMPACASFSKHVFEHSSFLVSLRSVFSRMTLSSSHAAASKGGSGKLSGSDGPASSAYGQSQRLVSAKAENPYIELREPARNGWSAGQYSIDARTVDGHAHHHHTSGIRKTVSVDIV